MIKTGIIIRSKRIFVLNYSSRQKKYFSDINVKNSSENKKLLKTRKPFFSNKGLNKNNIVLLENNEIVREEEIIANIMNNHFGNITTHLNLKPTKVDPKANLVRIMNILK